MSVSFLRRGIGIQCMRPLPQSGMNAADEPADICSKDFGSSCQSQCLGIRLRRLGLGSVDIQYISADTESTSVADREDFQRIGSRSLIGPANDFFDNALHNL